MAGKVLHGAIADLPNAPGAFMEGTIKKVVFGPTRFWPDYVMRCWIAEPHGGEETTHHHPWPHWIVVISGECENVIDDEYFTMKAGDWAHIPGNAEHRFKNISDTEKLMMLCIVPPEGDVAITGKGC